MGPSVRSACRLLARSAAAALRRRYGAVAGGPCQPSDHGGMLTPFPALPTAGADSLPPVALSAFDVGGLLRSLSVAIDAPGCSKGIVIGWTGTGATVLPVLDEPAKVPPIIDRPPPPTVGKIRDGAGDAGGKNAPMRCNRMLKIRRRKMNKHKYRKRLRKNRVRTMRKQLVKRRRSELRWRSAVDAVVADARQFDAAKYVESVLDKVVQVRQSESAKAQGGPPEAQQYKHEHWTELMSVEDIYGLPNYDYIDKTAGIPSNEEWRQMLKQRRLYYDQYYGKE